jgi:plasmid stabilization system protein ParE
MAAQSRRMTVSLSPVALAKLDEIGDWNARTFSPDHAHRYVTFLKTETAKLSTLYFAGKPVPTRPKFSYITIRKRRGGHGHIAVYQSIGEGVYVLTYYHAAQDWQAKVKEESEQE